MEEIAKIVGIAFVYIVVAEVIIGTLALLVISTISPHFLQRKPKYGATGPRYGATSPTPARADEHPRFRSSERSRE